MIVECLVMSDMIQAFYLVIFRIRHYGKFSFGHGIRSDRVFRWGHRVFGTRSLESEVVLLPNSTRN